MTQESRNRKKGGIPAGVCVIAAAAFLGILGGVIGVNFMGTDVAEAAEVVYPRMAAYPDEDGNGYEKWSESRRAQLCSVEGYADSLWDFYSDSTRTYLSGSQENRAYSPLNLYMALSSLAECCGGESREQILDLMKADSIDELRTQAGRVWNANYCDDGALKSLLAGSVWLSSDVGYSQSVLDSLAENYYTSAHIGDFGTEQMNRSIRNWLSKQTGGFLEDAVSNVAPNADTVLALYSTVYFKGRWDQTFDPNRTESRTFHAPSGDIQREFMSQSGYRDYYWGEEFGAVELPFITGCEMWLILPDEGKSIDDVLASGEYMEMISAGSGEYTNKRYVEADVYLSRFDISSTTDLRTGLESLGVTGVFSGGFSELCTGGEDVFLSKVSQSARVAVDEDGCTAASFTEMLMCGSALPPEVDKIEFVLDRPFMFVITGIDGQPLFTGTVYQP